MASTLDIGHLTAAQLVVDGALDEWPALDIAVVEPELPEPARNRLDAAFGWETERLCLAFRMHDLDPVAAPPNLDAYRFHLTDSLQWYVDALGNSGSHMDDDDLNLILLPDGRLAVLRGDLLLAHVHQARVPQRESRSVAVEYASRAHAGGWQGEVCLPAASLGVTHLLAGATLRTDLAFNDWLDTLPGVIPGSRDPEASLSELLAPAAADVAPDSRLKPWSWRSGRDFGFPPRWQMLRLTGAPSWWQQLRASGLKVWWLAPLLLISLFVAEWRVRGYRRQVQMLLRALQAGPDPPTAQEQQTPALADAAPPAGQEQRHAAFCARVLEWVRAHLSEALTPDRVARQFHVSLRTLQRRLREGLDTRPQDLILAARLDAADRLLRQSALRVGEIAERCGFEDPAYFARRFREHFGCRPSERRGNSAG